MNGDDIKEQGTASSPAQAEPNGPSPEPSSTETTSGGGNTAIATPKSPTVVTARNNLVALPKKRKLGVALLILSLAVFFIGGGVYTYLAVYVPNKPENVLKSALAQTFSESLAGTAVYKLDGEVSVVDAENVGINGVTFNAILNTTNSSFDVHADVDATVTTIGVDARRPSEGTKTYVRLTGLEGIDSLLAGYLGDGQDVSQNIEFGSFVSNIVTGINNQWFEIEDSLVDQATDGATTDTKGLSDADINAIKTAYENNSFLAVINQKQDEVINGVNSNQYQVGINKQALESFLQEIKEANISAIKITDDEIQTVLSQPLNETITVWIAKDSKQFTQFAFTTVQEGVTYIARIAFTTTTDFTQITAPDDSKSFLELMGELSPLLSGQNQSATSEASSIDYELYQQCALGEQYAANNNGDRSLVPDECNELFDTSL